MTFWNAAKWGLRSTTVNKAGRCDEIPAELFKSLKDDAIKVLQSLCQQIWKTQQWPQDWKKAVLIPIPKKGNTKECANPQTIALISGVQHIDSVLLQIVGYYKTMAVIPCAIQYNAVTYLIKTSDFSEFLRC